MVGPMSDLFLKAKQHVRELDLVIGRTNVQMIHCYAEFVGAVHRRRQLTFSRISPAAPRLPSIDP
jgi:hypothetical protein